MNKLQVNNERMNQFCETIATQCRTAVFERSEDILKAWQETILESQDEEGTFPKLKLGFGVTVDLEAGKIETKIRFTCAYKSIISDDIPDPNKLEMFS